ncbi:B12-binding domain/radical SAM domain protein, rhizo-twelve system [Rhodoblastus acidophilus]|uniref:B12-binding domain/radical SAM domain protein, rhizo-twelve system n=1 Tax=Rhodoblastus acidophilus TaxID=1074 RepID=A0A212RQ70_RHOAC|nr:TIGR04295 family B12-binding domain-containing radical SAM protein [Rhodoblastus acidophilus]PPQ38533.1 B12-binding domain/radical SAM domain-containing protein [Rhodoblastus acidophilus]RAI21846.1 B12-binding domain/radical SAM domain-containing protein [Rhodoblastus acidophilus]SNB74746.1 B12-binding domain/radical SAM domain protein, rhizo-twelve system [Rhodoblastus acidophilus]
MRVALVNPRWRFDRSIYFGCRAPHLPLELGCAKALLERAGHETLLCDGGLMERDDDEIAREVKAFGADFTVVPTAPSYLFWRCAPPELRTPRAFLLALGDDGGRTVIVGPHGSVTPETTLAKLGADIVVRGECEEALLEIANGSPLGSIAGLAFRDGEAVRTTGEPRATVFTDLPALTWPDAMIAAHRHHHHRFDALPDGPGAEVEASRGCPYHCSFCAKIDFRDAYRRRDLSPLLHEIDRLMAQGATYLYFIDEIFLPQKPLLEALVARRIPFGIQTRIDLWKPSMLDLLGEARCVSIEAGVESLTPEGRATLDKNCRLSTDALAERLIHARRRVPFVQANLIESPGDDVALVESWRDKLRRAGVWANDPVPLYPYPSSPDYRRLWGEPDGEAWERAHAYYLRQFTRFSDIQEDSPLPLPVLEASCAHCR